jgi:hypothetical protein
MIKLGLGGLGGLGMVLGLFIFTKYKELKYIEDVKKQNINIKYDRIICSHNYIKYNIENMLKHMKTIAQSHKHIYNKIDNMNGKITLISGKLDDTEDIEDAEDMEYTYVSK